MEDDKVKEHNIGVMEECLKDNFQMGSVQDMELKDGVMVVILKVNIQTD